MGAPKLSKATLTITQDLTDWCHEAVITTFATLLGETVVMHSVRFENDLRSAQKYGVSGVIGFIQEGLDGTLALCFDDELLFRIMTKFYGEETRTVNDNLVGGVSELTKVVFGMIKEKCNERGFNFHMCLPVVIIGSNHSMFSAISNNKAVIEYRIGSDSFWLEVSTMAQIREA